MEKKKDRENISVGESVSVSLEGELKVDVLLQYRGKSSVKKNKRPTFEFKGGQEFSHSKQKYVDRDYHIDRENDKYKERVTDRQNGEIIHQEESKLSEHFGHGSNKNGKK